MTNILERLGAARPHRRPALRVPASIARTLPLIAALVHASACSSKEPESCSTATTEVDFRKESSLGFSMEEALEDRQERFGTLHWNPTRDWLPHTADEETLIVLMMQHDGSDVELVEHDDYGCDRALSTGMQLQILSADGQLDIETGATLYAFAKDDLVLEAAIDSDELMGRFQIQGNGGLQFWESFSSGDETEGSLTAWREVETDGSLNLRTAEIAYWQAEVGDAPVIEAGSPDPNGGLILDPEADVSDAGPMSSQTPGISAEASTPPILPEAGSDAAAPTADASVDPQQPAEAGVPLGPDTSAPPQSNDASVPTPPADASANRPDASRSPTQSEAGPADAAQLNRTAATSR